MVDFDYELEYKLSKGNVVANAQSRKSELAVITIARCDIQDAIRDDLQRDPEAKQLMDLAARGKTRCFWVENGLLLTAGRRIYMPKFGTIRRHIMKESTTHYGPGIQGSVTREH